MMFPESMDADEFELFWKESVIAGDWRVRAERNFPHDYDMNGRPIWFQPSRETLTLETKTHTFVYIKVVDLNTGDRGWLLQSAQLGVSKNE